MLGVAKTSYYRLRKPPAVNEAEVLVRESVRDTFWQHSRRYGSRRLRVELQGEGLAIGRQRIRRIMKEEGLKAIQPKRFVPRTTDSGHQLGYAENLLAGTCRQSIPTRSSLATSPICPCKAEVLPTWRPGPTCFRAW